jgi:hypothetical protein
MKFQLSKIVTSDTLDYQNGEYRRSFDRSQQPFEATDEEWAGLQRTGYFEPVNDASPPQGEDSQAAEAEHQAAASQRSRRKKGRQDQPAEENLNDVPNS